MTGKYNWVFGSSMLMLAITALGPVPQCFAEDAVKVAGVASTNAAELARIQIKALEEDISQSNKDISVSFGRLTKLYLQESMSNKLVETCSRIIADRKDPVAVTVAATTLSSFYSQNRDFDTAAKVFEGVLAKDGGLDWQASRVTMAKLLSSIYLTNLGKSKDALTVLEKESYRCPSNDMVTASDLLNLRAQILQANLADPTGAVNCCQAVIAMGAAVPPITLDAVQNRLIGLYFDLGARDQSMAIVQQFISSGNVPATIAGYVKKLIDSGASPAQCSQAADVIRAKILASKASVPTVEVLQPSLINLLLRQGKMEEALQEARVLYYLSSDKGLLQAIDMVAQTFKAVDSNLARANQFLKFQKCGMAGEDGKVGTPDDLRNPLSDIPVNHDETRIRAMTEGMAALPLDSTGYRRRAEMYLYVDQHVEAFLAFQKSLELCAMTTNELQSATDALTGLIIRCTKDVSLAEKLVEYIMLGSSGKDGRLGTADDLKNPVPVILERLRYAQAMTKASQAVSSGTGLPAPSSPDKVSAPPVTPGI